MKCPFCGEDMVPGAMQTKRVRIMDWEYRWLPPAEEGPEQVGRESLPEPARALLDKVERHWKVSGWDEEKAVELRPAKEGEQGLEGVLLSGNICYEGAWYCPKCEKALWLLERAREDSEWPEPEEESQKDEPRPPETVPSPKTEAPSRRPKPRDDPWEEKGFFGRRKRPDWEK
ncbi:PF20097 family protein [Intestinimonas sp. CLA-AA-H199]|nr:PF20097 family protein [Intestinimonas aquisgranensis]